MLNVLLGYGREESLHDTEILPTMQTEQIGDHTNVVGNKDVKLHASHDNTNLEGDSQMNSSENTVSDLIYLLN